MTIQDYIDKHGTRNTARAMLNKRVQAVCGLSLDDLSDTCEISDTCDEIESFLEDGDIQGAKDCLKEIDLDFLAENEGMGNFDF